MNSTKKEQRKRTSKTTPTIIAVTGDEEFRNSSFLERKMNVLTRELPSFILRVRKPNYHERWNNYGVSYLTEKWMFQRYIHKELPRLEHISMLAFGSDESDDEFLEGADVLVIFGSSELDALADDKGIEIKYFQSE